MHCSSRYRIRASGIALVLVLWVIVMLSIMAGSFSLNMRREIDLVRNSREAAEAGPVAEAGIYYAMFRLIATDEQKKWRSDGSVYEFLFGGARVRVRIHDEAGKIDLNRIPDLLLSNILGKAGISDDQVGGLVDAIGDWRDLDDLKRVNGAEMDEYSDAGRVYGPRNQLFHTIQELRLVLGVSGELYRKLEPVMTVYNETQGIDPTKSSREVLMMLPDLTEETIDTYLDERTSSAQNHLPPPQFPIPVQGVLFSQASGITFSVYSESLFPDGRHAVVSAVIKRAGSVRTPFVFLDWKRQFPGAGSLFAESVVVVNGSDES